MLIFQTKLEVILDIIFDSTLVGGWEEEVVGVTKIWVKIGHGINVRKKLAWIFKTCSFFLLLTRTWHEKWKRNKHIWELNYYDVCIHPLGTNVYFIDREQGCEQGGCVP